MSAFDPNAAVAAIREMGVLTGARIERKEVGTRGEFDALTDDELLARRLKQYTRTKDQRPRSLNESDGQRCVSNNS